MITVKRDGGLWVPSAYQVQKAIKDIIRGLANHLRDWTRERIRDRGEGAGGTALEGYSTNPLVVRFPGRPKARRKPRGGIKTKRGMFFPGGYAEYRQKAGLTVERFQMFNLGNLWRDWQVLVYGTNSTPSRVGFTDDNNAMAADQASIKRPLLFKVTPQEVGMVNDDVIAIIADLFTEPPTRQFVDL